jgi:hypothetical protein
MGKLTRQYNFRFTDEQMANLERLAAKTNSVASKGPNARKPSVTVMFEGIADGKLIFVEREPWSLPAGLAEAAAAVEERQREQACTEQRKRERLEEQRRRITEHPKQAQKTPLKMQQLNMLELEPA